MSCNFKFSFRASQSLWLLRFAMLLSLLLCCGCRTASTVRTATEKISSTTANVGSTILQGSSTLQASEEQLSLVQIIETYSMDTLTGQTYLASRTTTTLNKQSADRREEADSLKVSLNAEVSTADSTYATNEVEVTAEETAATGLANKLGEAVIVFFLILAFWAVLVWYTKK